MNRNSAASIRTRLKQHTNSVNQDFNLTLTHFGLERLLYRLSISEHRQNFLLKGALLFGLWYDIPHRATRDADLLCFGPDDIETVVSIFRSLCEIVVDDGIEFDSQSVQGKKIRKQAGYGGVQLHIIARLDNARITLQIDVGFGDAVTPGPVFVNYPVLLEELPPPHLRAYPKYTVVAEKLNAICVLGMNNSRMKDYFDLWILLRSNDLESALLRQAIEATFTRRRTPPLTRVPVGLSEDFATDVGKKTQWQAFLNKNKIAPVELKDVVLILRNAFQQIYTIRHK